MKTTITTKTFWFCTVLLLFGSTLVFSQALDCRQKTKFMKPWSLNANFGITSYFGDLSIYDHNISKKNSRESGNSFGITLTKHFNKVIGLSGQTLYGHIQAYHNKYDFKTELFEYNIHARLDLTNLFLANEINQVGVVGYAGIGHLLFKTLKNIEIGLQTLEIVNKSNVPEFICFFGGSVYYNLSNKLGVTADLAIRQFQNDRLDDFIQGDNYDYYSYLSVGISYHFYNL
ncbi:MAG: hypothetical protein DRJ05_15280 [Bacteroidetes bacterium]|nr:MAG: hypothetical protein DRJ05_15280 [Bacteroidota bacterium]